MTLADLKFVTHLFGKITHTFTQKLLNIYIFISISTKKRTKLIDSDIYAALLLAKIAAICVFLLCKIFGPKIWSCKTFDKFQVWSNTSHNQYVWDASKKNLMLYFLGVAYSGNSYFGFFGSPGVRCEKAIVWV